MILLILTPIMVLLVIFLRNSFNPFLITALSSKTIIKLYS